MVHWICLISWRLFDVWTSNFGIMSQYDTTFDLEINVGHCDLYFMVQWFCLIAYIVFDGWISYFWKMSQCNTTLDLKINLGHSDLYFTVQWFLFFFFLLWKHFSFIGKAQFRQAMLSCNSSYLYSHLLNVCWDCWLQSWEELLFGYSVKLCIRRCCGPLGSKCCCCLLNFCCCCVCPRYWRC